jgi:hypothetical protein
LSHGIALLREMVAEETPVDFNPGLISPRGRTDNLATARLGPGCISLVHFELGLGLVVEISFRIFTSSSIKVTLLYSSSNNNNNLPPPPRDRLFPVDSISGLASALDVWHRLLPLRRPTWPTSKPSCTRLSNISCKRLITYESLRNSST